MKQYDVTALGELLIDFTENGVSEQGNPVLEANPGGAPCNVLAMLKNSAEGARLSEKSETTASARILPIPSRHAALKPAA